MAVLLPAFNKIGIAFDQEEFAAPQDVGFRSPLLNEIVFALPKVKAPIQSIIQEINLAKAKEGKMDSLWTDDDKYPDIQDASMVRCSSYTVERD